MKPAPFRYCAPDSLEETLALLEEHGDDAKVLAGGQSLVPAMNFRLARPAVLVDLDRVPGLADITSGDGLRIGAMVRQRTAERSAEVAAMAPLLHRALPFVAHPQIRNRGTVGGSLAHADPAAELPAVAVALDATFRLEGAGGGRRVKARDFYIGLFETALRGGEILVAVEIETPAPRSGAAFVEFSRRHGDFGLAGVAATLTLDEEDRLEQVSIGLCGVGESPVLAGAASAFLAGGDGDGAALAEAGRVAAVDDIDPPGDIHASSEFRRHLVGVLVARALEAALSEARRAGGAA